MQQSNRILIAGKGRKRHITMKPLAERSSERRDRPSLTCFARQWSLQNKRAMLDFWLESCSKANFGEGRTCDKCKARGLCEALYVDLYA